MGAQGAERYVAVDLGAESGRVMVGTLRGDRLRLEEVHRFPNVPVRTPDGLHWDVLHLYAQVLDGLRAARACGPLVSVGVDSWAADHGLLDGGGRLLGEPYHYRDSRTDGVAQAVAERVPPQVHYARTGKFQLPFDTVFQLLAMRRVGDRRLELAERLLMIPDLLHYWLSGAVGTEYTNASTTGLLGVEGRWAADLLQALELPGQILCEPVQPGTRIGTLRPAVADAVGLPDLQVVAPATHDTASAVCAVPHPADGQPWAYISSGTWSLLGLELRRAVTSAAARGAAFTNEGGVDHTYRFLTNITGLWLLQECRRSWARAGLQVSYEELTAAAAAAGPAEVVIDVDDPAFLHPADMPLALAEHLRRTGQPAVSAPERLTRAVLEGLALRYRAALQEAERLAGVRVEVIHIVGGGSHNALLCQMTADACQRPVLAGPAEATAAGNVLLQAQAQGAVRDLDQIRQVVRDSFPLTAYTPGDAAPWEEHAARLEARRSGASR